jgi:hypothetical protein
MAVPNNATNGKQQTPADKVQFVIGDLFDQLFSRTVAPFEGVVEALPR